MSVRMIVWLATWSVATYAAVGVVIWCEVKMVNYFRELGPAMHENTRKMHQEFRRALVAMVGD